MSFASKVVIVTGASSGIGAAAAIQFAEQGASVVLVGRNVTKLAAVETTCAARGAKPLVITADITNDQDAQRIIDDTIKQYGKLDVLVNNAGVFNRGIDYLRHKNFMETFNLGINTNLRAAVYLTYLACPHLIKTKGNIVNVSSVISMKAWPMLAYPTSKAALDHFTRCVALELAPLGVRVNVVNPGPVMTDLLENGGLDKALHDAAWNEYAARTAMGKVAQPDDVANVILFLASDKARSVTGSNYVTDYGLLLK